MAKAKRLQRSSVRFSIGVPVRTIRCARAQVAGGAGRLRQGVLDVLGFVEDDGVPPLGAERLGGGAELGVVDDDEVRRGRDGAAGAERGGDERGGEAFRLQ
jgi:hypothetical protein